MVFIRITSEHMLRLISVRASGKTGGNDQESGAIRAAAENAAETPGRDTCYAKADQKI